MLRKYNGTTTDSRNELREELAIFNAENSGLDTAADDRVPTYNERGVLVVTVAADHKETVTRQANELTKKKGDLGGVTNKKKPKSSLYM